MSPSYEELWRRFHRAHEAWDHPRKHGDVCSRKYASKQRTDIGDGQEDDEGATKVVKSSASCVLSIDGTSKRDKYVCIINPH